jgi:hypothetical protein
MQGLRLDLLTIASESFHHRANLTPPATRTRWLTGAAGLGLPCTSPWIDRGVVPADFARGAGGSRRSISYVPIVPQNRPYTAARAPLYY